MEMLNGTVLDTVVCSKMEKENEFRNVKDMSTHIRSMLPSKFCSPCFHHHGSVVFSRKQICEPKATSLLSTGAERESIDAERKLLRSRGERDPATRMLMST